MADFTREFLDDDIPGDDAWSKITSYLKDGYKSVEVLSRRIDGQKKWELRAWPRIRDDDSNAAGTEPDT